ncbi:unnamed protein product [Cercospora beticola]|nr:unnamed protein product [Cercospora beticola]
MAMITLVMPTATQEYQATSASPTATIATFQATAATTKIPASRHNKKTGQLKDGAELKAPRVGHKKSRKGCAQCKRRHVKCNEEAPCSNFDSFFIGGYNSGPQPAEQVSTGGWIDSVAAHGAHFRKVFLFAVQPSTSSLSSRRTAPIGGRS